VRLIRWTTPAAEQFETAVKHIQRDNPEAGRKLAQTVIDRINQLATSPGIGRPGEVKGTRELAVPPYIVVYRHTDEVVEILYIWHGAQDWR
jgi:toxin ParE1/3/4